MSGCEQVLRVGAVWMLSAASVLVCASAGAELHADHCLHGCPAGSPASNDVVVRSIYVLSSNDATKFADWVAYRVTEGSIGSTATRRWKADPALASSETLEPADYRGANAVLGTDRGHQAPLASFTGTGDWEETNYLSNITPQRSGLNQGPWKGLEDAVRALAKTRGDRGVYVMTGPLYEGNMAPLPEADEGHLVPSGYWKIISVRDEGMIRLAGYVFDQNTERSASHCDVGRASSPREIEERTGLDFFHGLDRDRQERIETGPATLAEELGCTGPGGPG